MKRQKDNLTDLTEQLPESDRWTDDGDKNQRVVDVDGEIITLGIKQSDKGGARSKGKVLELSVEDLQKIISMTAEITAKELVRLVHEKLEESFPRGNKDL